MENRTWVPRAGALAVLALGLAACVVVDGGADGSRGPDSDSLTRAAEEACVARANEFSKGNSSFVVSSEYSEANTKVIVEDHLRDRYRCLSSNDGIIADFSVM